MNQLADKPFNLSKTQIEGIEKRLNKMTEDEKIKQLFCPIVFMKEPEALKAFIDKYQPGGILYREGPGEEIQTCHRVLQDTSKLPLLIAANLEAGGKGIAEEGTYYGSQMLVAATDNERHGYQLGKVACSEGAAVGVNWSFSPILDIDDNYRNPITNVRTYGQDVGRIIRMAKGYVQGAKEANVATAIKHFPGDGQDERDQHLLTSVNTMDRDQWHQTYGKIYQSLIDEGVLTVMAGHISLPAYEADGKNNVPATLSKSLLQELLRGQLGFNGLIVTDATPMVGFGSAMERQRAVPLSIENGCDMFLFNRNYDEDIMYMKNGLAKGLLSYQRLNEAVVRILATKEALGLFAKQDKKELVPLPDALTLLGNKKHKEWAKACANEGITLVKDTQDLLPLSADRTPRVLLQMIGGFESNDRVYEQVERRLTQDGFQVTAYEKEDFQSLVDSVEELKKTYDLVIYIGNVETASNKTVARIHWHTFFGMGNNIPWFVHEIPTLFVSLGNPYHLLDVPMIKTYINAYCNSETVIDQVIEKMMGRSEFKGINPVDPFCGRHDTKY